MAQKDSLNIFYDEDADILYISFGKPRPAISHEIEDGILLRIAPRTKKVVGLTILYFSERKREKAKPEIKVSIPIECIPSPEIIEAMEAMPSSLR